MKARLSDALLKRWEQIPDTFKDHVDASLLAFEQVKEEPWMRKRSVSAAALIAALLVLTMGAALALNSLGLLDFLDYAPSPTVKHMVQSNFKNNMIMLGDCTITVKEAISDGLSGALVVEYSVPEGMYLYAPDARAMGTYHSAETESVEELLKKYTTLYMPMDEHIGWLKDGMTLPPGTEYGFDPVKVADNAVVVQIGFAVGDDGLDTFVYEPGVFKITSADNRERLTSEPMLLGMAAQTADNVQKTADVPKALADAGVMRIDVTFTPLSMLVKLTFKAESAYYLSVLDEKGDEFPMDFLSSFAASYADNLTRKAAYTRPESIPDTLFIQLYEYADKGRMPLGGPVLVTLK